MSVTKKCCMCNKEFECNSNDIMHCQCSRIELSNEERVFVAKKFNDCLCLNCLQALKVKFKKSK